MKKLLIVVLVVLTGVIALGYWRGWFSVNMANNKEIQVDSAKYKQDKEAIGKSLGGKAKELKDKIATLWKKTEGLAEVEKVQAKKDLAELEAKHERLEKQLKDLEEANADKFESIKQDLSKALEDVEKMIDELTKKITGSKGN